MEDAETEFKDARFIQYAERDVSLNLDALRWPLADATPPGWTLSRRDNCLRRRILAGGDRLMGGDLEERLLRFPSAPLLGWQRLREYHVRPDESQNFHTYRVLSRPGRDRRAERIFLMHNGLNEIDRMDLYYQLASHLVHSDVETVCVIRPFPGHLTRFPSQAFAETPLDRYLWDGSQLFRQYLRYMIETQWFLSAIVPRSSYRSLAGADLLAEDDDPQRSRVNPDILAAALASAWHSLHHASKRVVAQMDDSELHMARLKPAIRGQGRFRDAIASMRDALGVNTDDRRDRTSAENDEEPATQAVRDAKAYERLDGTLGEDDEEPVVHVIGYSLGGFTAQSVFMSWPFLVASCSTVLSGGALRELSPTAFAHREEWQTVLHSLRYELDDAMMEGRNGRKTTETAGIENDLFPFLKRTFYEVFQQEYRGSFQSRLAAYMQRMLFIVGGNDPIVQTRSVLDSGPPDGINMLTIGGLGHFIGAQAADEREKEQRRFWLPEMARIVHRFSASAKEKQRQERPYTWVEWVDGEMRFIADPPDENGDSEYSKPHKKDSENPEPPEGYRARRLSAGERLAIPQDGALHGRLFERCLDDMLARQDGSRGAPGLLLILRNELPTMLLDRISVYRRAAMLNHDDLSTARYVQGVLGRRKIFESHRERIALIIPWNARIIMATMDSHRGYPSQAEASKGEMPRYEGRGPDDNRGDCWGTQFSAGKKLGKGKGRHSVLVFDGREKLEVPEALLRLARDETHYCDLDEISSLPDCWVWMSRDFLRTDEETLTVTRGLKKLADVLPDYFKDSRSALAGPLRRDELRIVTVSRARYNPRFRGRVVADPKTARDLLLHAALCASASTPSDEFNLETGQRRVESQD